MAALHRDHNTPIRGMVQRRMIIIALRNKKRNISGSPLGTYRTNDVNRTSHSEPLEPPWVGGSPHWWYWPFQEDCLLKHSPGAGAPTFRLILAISATQCPLRRCLGIEKASIRSHFNGGFFFVAETLGSARRNPPCRLLLPDGDMIDGARTTEARKKNDAKQLAGKSLIAG